MSGEEPPESPEPCRQWRRRRPRNPRATRRAAGELLREDEGKWVAGARGGACRQRRRGLQATAEGLAGEVREAVTSIWIKVREVDRREREGWGWQIGRAHV